MTKDVIGEGWGAEVTRKGSRGQSVHDQDVGLSPKQERESISAQLIGSTTRAVRTHLFDVLVEVVEAFGGICELGIGYNPAV